MKAPSMKANNVVRGDTVEALPTPLGGDVAGAAPAEIAPDLPTSARRMRMRPCYPGPRCSCAQPANKDAAADAHPGRASATNEPHQTTRDSPRSPHTGQVFTRGSHTALPRRTG